MTKLAVGDQCKRTRVKVSAEWQYAVRASKQRDPAVSVMGNQIGRPQIRIGGTCADDSRIYRIYQYPQAMMRLA